VPARKCLREITADDGTFGPVPSGNHPTVALVVDGRAVEVPDDGGTLLDALRDHAGCTDVKDGCSPQGQCGCCTVLVDGQARVACVTPVRRVAGRAVTTVTGLPDARRWADALCATGGTQCGFCTPGIVVRLAGTAVAQADRALLAHLCRCTGWQPILDAAALVDGNDTIDPWAGRDPEAAARRAAIEGGTPQHVGPDVALGGGGFAADTAPPGALIAVPDGNGDWVVAETLAEARRRAGKVQGRRTTEAAEPPLALPEGDWALTLRTSWCEPGYLETDASWCEPGGEPATPLANGGAFGGKATSPLPAVARRLADEHGRPVLALWSREDATRLGPKRPPIAAGVRADGTGVVRVARTPGIADALRSFPGLDLSVEEFDVPGPPTSVDLRAAGWAEAALLRIGLDEVATVGPATARLDEHGALHVTVDAGDPLDEVVLRSYCTGAAHQALGWVASEGIAVADDGEVLDLTIRSFGILRAVDLPPIHVTITPSDGPPTRAGDAVFAAVAGAAWVAQGCPPDLPTRRPYRRE
jgi:aerobic-type carbon monoxide dehydrogenase small subunit (CoxS/CutS family)